MQLSTKKAILIGIFSASSLFAGHALREKEAVVPAQPVSSTDTLVPAPLPQPVDGTYVYIAPFPGLKP